MPSLNHRIVQPILLPNDSKVIVLEKKKFKVKKKKLSESNMQIEELILLR